MKTIWKGAMDCEITSHEEHLHLYLIVYYIKNRGVIE